MIRDAKTPMVQHKLVLHLKRPSRSGELLHAVSAITTLQGAKEGVPAAAHLLLHLAALAMRRLANQFVCIARACADGGREKAPAR
eukprot:294194-Chlamydomonas_euryale.AAC.3